MLYADGLHLHSHQGRVLACLHHGKNHSVFRLNISRQKVTIALEPDRLHNLACVPKTFDMVRWIDLHAVAQPR